MARRFESRSRIFYCSGIVAGLRPRLCPLSPKVLEITMAQIILGQSAVPLYGPWKFTVGDSPVDPKPRQAAVGRAGV